MTFAFLHVSPSGKNGTPFNNQVKALSHFASLGNQILLTQWIVNHYKSKSQNSVLFVRQLIEIHYQEVGIQFLDFFSK